MALSEQEILAELERRKKLSYSDTYDEEGVMGMLSQFADNNQNLIPSPLEAVGEVPDMLREFLGVLGGRAAQKMFPGGEDPMQGQAPSSEPMSPDVQSQVGTAELGQFLEMMDIRPFTGAAAMGDEVYQNSRGNVSKYNDDVAISRYQAVVDDAQNDAVIEKTGKRLEDDLSEGDLVRRSVLAGVAEDPEALLTIMGADGSKNPTMAKLQSFIAESMGIDMAGAQESSAEQVAADESEGMGGMLAAGGTAAWLLRNFLKARKLKNITPVGAATGVVEDALIKAFQKGGKNFKMPPVGKAKGSSDIAEMLRGAYTTKQRKK